jgi:hypothetical protein
VTATGTGRTEGDWSTLATEIPAGSGLLLGAGGGGGGVAVLPDPYYATPVAGSASVDLELADVDGNVILTITLCSVDSSGAETGTQTTQCTPENKSIIPLTWATPIKKARCVIDVASDTSASFSAGAYGAIRRLD